MIPYLLLGYCLFILALLLLDSRHKNIKKTFREQASAQIKTLERKKEQDAQTIESLSQMLNGTKLLSIVAQQSENAIMLMNEHGDILWVNNSFTRMYEYTYKEFTAALGTNIRRTSFNPKIIERLNICTNQKIPVTYEALNITKTGKELWTHTSLIPLLSEHQEVIGMVTIDSDIHKRIKAGEELVNHIRSFNLKIEKISEQLNVMVSLTDSLFERIEKSKQKIDRTDQIIGYVKKISDQTKILGINASIEANVAGQHGKGFRVIANEMVNISTITSDSLKEINGLIQNVKTNSEKLGNEKELSESAISMHRILIDELKQQINEVERMATQLT